MERLEKLINILKLTPHKQPELVKEAAHRILSRPVRTDTLVGTFLKPLIEILIQYCDTDDSVLRSLFNDYLNTVILTFQYQHYQTILLVLLSEVTNNGSQRTVTAALHRLPLLINNVRPIKLGCEPHSMLKALIEVSRRSQDESVLKALQAALEQVVPYLDYYVRKNKETQLLYNALIDILLLNTRNESSHTQRLAASSLATICLKSEHLSSIIVIKLNELISSLNCIDAVTIRTYVGLCMCIRTIPVFASDSPTTLVQTIVRFMESEEHDIVLTTSSLETLYELFKYPIEPRLLSQVTTLIVDKFLLETHEKSTTKQGTKIIVQSNALACISQIVKQEPSILDRLDAIFLFRDHPDVAIRNKLIVIIGNYIEASWRFPLCIERSVDCERIRKLWLELRITLNDDTIHPDTLKSCIVAIKTCISQLLDSDHCLHIIEYHDIDRIIQLYYQTNFKPLKVEILSLFANLNYRTLYYLERCHWSKIRSKSAGSLVDCLQDRILNLIDESLLDEHLRIKAAATSTLIAVIPLLFISSFDTNAQNSTFLRSSDAIVSQAQDLASEHLVILKKAQKQVSETSANDEAMMTSDNQDKLNIRADHKFLSSRINQDYEIVQNHTQRLNIAKSSHQTSISINLMYCISRLRSLIENNLDKGKSAITSVVRALYDISQVYPIYQYLTAWDCRASEYCDCYTLLNFLLTYLENLTEPDIIVEDLEAYRHFLCLSCNLLYALCHESVSHDYDYQRMKPYHKRQANTRDGYWSELTVKHVYIADILDVFFTHLTKLLWLLTYTIEGRNNPFNLTTKQPSTPQHKSHIPESLINHGTLISNRLLFCRMHKKLESSFKSSKKNLNQRDEKFYQVLETCLGSMSSLLEFIGMNKSIDLVKEILGHLSVTSHICRIHSLICARQLLKSLFGINILALYQADPNDWFTEESELYANSNMATQDNSNAVLHGVYSHLIAKPYKTFSSLYAVNCSQITPNSDKAFATLNFNSRQVLKVRRRIEDRIKTLFEFNPQQLVSPKIKQISEQLKNIITEFTSIVNDCMTQFLFTGQWEYQSEILHFMSYLILLRVNYQKLAQADGLINSINKLIDECGDKMYHSRLHGIESFLSNSFSFLLLLSYDRGPSKAMFQAATVIQKFDDLRAKLSMNSIDDKDVSIYIAPLLRCMVEDLFIYRTKHFQNSLSKQETAPLCGETDIFEMVEQPRKDMYELVEAERETVAQKLLDFINNPEIYDLVAILILESRQNSGEIKYKKLSQHLTSIIPGSLLKRRMNIEDSRCSELTSIIENISPEVFHPVKFIFESLLKVPTPSSGTTEIAKEEFRRWMSLVIISMHILITQVKEEVFLSRLRELMSEESFVEYLLHIAQICIAEIITQLYNSHLDAENKHEIFLVQQLSSYMMYLTHMFQSGLFFQLSRTAAELIRREVIEGQKLQERFRNLCIWARDTDNNFSLDVSEKMFYYMKLRHPDLTIFWCNVMMLLNNVDCNRDYWTNLLVYECHHCSFMQIQKQLELLSFESDVVDIDSENKKKIMSKFRRNTHINRPSSLNLSDISFSDQLRRSFIKKIAASETRDKALNRNIIATSDETGQLLEREVSIGNTEQCLSPNIELSRRGALCLVLDFVTISMNDVEHITWLIIHHINDIIRWSHETPISEFINSVHGNSASSGIFIQAINSGFNNLSSISLVTRLLWTLERVHYTQYGSLVVLLVEKLLCSDELFPYRSLTRRIEEFACSTVVKLLNETNRSLVTTNDEVINQLTAEDLMRIYSMLDVDLYPELSKLLLDLKESTQDSGENPSIHLHKPIDQDSDDDSEKDDIEVLCSKANLVYWLSDQGWTASISTLLPALNTIKEFLADPSIVDKINEKEDLICYLVSAVYSLVMNILPPPTRLSRPKFWCSQNEESKGADIFRSGFSEKSSLPIKPLMLVETKRNIFQSDAPDKLIHVHKDKSEQTQEDTIEGVRIACLKALFLYENLEYLRITQFEYLSELIIRLARLPMLNSFILTPPALWRQNIWPLQFPNDDAYRVKLPIVSHDILSKEPAILESFCDRLLKIGWISRRQFEEAWMTLLGVLTSTLSEPVPSPQRDSYPGQDLEKKSNLLVACKTVSTITRLLGLTRKSYSGDPLSSDTYMYQSFDEKVIELTKAIATNLTPLRKKTQSVFESLDMDKRSNSRDMDKISLSKVPMTWDGRTNCFNNNLRIAAQKLRMNAILNMELDMQEIVVLDDSKTSNEIDLESCIRLLLSIYKQKLKDPSENLISQPSNQQQETSPSFGGDKSGGQINELQKTSQKPAPVNRGQNQETQLAPPLTTAICQSILSLSDLFADYEQFYWLFETFVNMFLAADRSEDEIQMQHLIVGLCKSASVCCYEVPNELATTTAINHREVMFEKCRQSIDRCIKSQFGPLKLNALFGVYYMLEDSINIVASGAWELDHFKQLRQSRLTWIVKLAPILLEKENSIWLTKNAQIVKLLELLCETVTESELRTAKP